MPDTARGADSQHDFAAPSAGSGGGLRDRIDRLSISSLVGIVGASLIGLGAVILFASILVVGWLNNASVDRAKWAETEAHLHHIDEIATDRFLSVVNAVNTGTEFEGTELIWHIDELMSSAQALAGGITLEDPGARLTEAAQRFANAADESNRSSPDFSIPLLRETFTGLHEALEDLSAVMATAQSAQLTEQAGRAETAMIVLVGGFALTVTIVVAGARLGMRVRNREESLLDELHDERHLLQTIIDTLPESIVWKDTNQRMLGCNAALRDRFAVNKMEPPENGLISDCCMEDALARYVDEVEVLEREVMESGRPVVGRKMVRPEPDGGCSVVLRTAIPLHHDEEVVGVLSTTRDITSHVQLERSLASASRLESIGQLSAGVAHEINTPVQFVSDNTAFLDDSMGTLLGVIERLSELAAAHDPEGTALIRKEADLEFLLEDIPDAVSQSREGLGQIAQIVQAMKAFAHPGGEIRPTSLNGLVTSTVDVSRNEWKYSATVELNLDEKLPDLSCDEGQIKQVILNMIVNAAHAIADRGDDKGVITIATGVNERYQTVAISDTGTGIPEDVQARMFERFFTTKDVGRGSGQGLAIAYDAVSAHGGEITVDSTVGVGTTFTIHIPINPPRPSSGTETAA